MHLVLYGEEYTSMHYAKGVQIRSFVLVRIFPYSKQIRENTDQKKTPYFDSFQAMIL